MAHGAPDDAPVAPLSQSKKQLDHPSVYPTMKRFPADHMLDYMFASRSR